MKNFSIGTVLKLLLLCIVVGWLLSLFGITPDNFWQGMGQLIRGTAETILNILENAWPYLVAGALVGAGWGPWLASTI